MRSESSKSSSNDEENSNKSHDTKLDGYCTIARSRSLSCRQPTTSSTDSEDCSNKRVDQLGFSNVSKKLRSFITHSDDTNLPYKKLQESGTYARTSGGGMNFGLSNDLSTESIKNACDCYDLSDDETDRLHAEAINNTLLEKIENRLSNFKRSSLRLSTKSATFDRKNKPDHFHPYCTLRHDKISTLTSKTATTAPAPTAAIATATTVPIKPYEKITEARTSSMTSNPDSLEAFNILNELDAILDNHTTTETSSLSSSSVVHDEPEKIEDCLLELDAYLEEIDRRSTSSFDDNKSTKSNMTSDNQNNEKVCGNKKSTIGNRFQRAFTLPKKLRSRESHIGDDHPVQVSEDSSDQYLKRGHKYRRTIAATRPIHECANNTDIKEGIRIAHPKTWRRHSMRKTSLLVLPDHKENSGNEPIVINNDAPDTSRLNEPLNSSHSIMEPNASVELEEIRMPNLVTSDPLTINNINPEGTAVQDVRRCLSQGDCCTYRAQDLTHLDIIHDILNNSSQENFHGCGRPRQYGRRAECHPRVISILAETSATGSQRIIVNHERPRSAPVISTARAIPMTTSLVSSECQRYIGSEPSSVGSSRNPSPISLLSSTGSSSVVSASPERSAECNQHTGNSSLDPDNIQVPINQGNNYQWPHGFSRILALLCCTLGLFNISRFAILTISYGGNFLLQFLILSIIFGIPMLWLQMCLGAKIKSGPISMWKISPICKGIGIALLLAQCIIALYSTISLGWILVYFRDSFISRNERYRWQEPFSIYRRPGNVTNNLTETVADYFNGIVLQRWQLGLGRRIETGGVRFQLAFNLAIIWSIVFIVLCKGLRSFGKIVLVLTLLPLTLFIIVCSKLLYIIDFSSVQNVFQASDFEDFLVNSKTWIAAAQETFLTWTFLGPSVIAISSRSCEKSEGKTVLRRDAIIVVVLTLFGLSMAALFGYACIQILENKKFIYYPGSFEHIDSYVFLYSHQTPNLPSHLSVPLKWTPHYSSVLGECYRRPQAIPFRDSGYQSLRLVTELFPATVAVATQDYISSVWTIMTFLMFLMFGLAQLCVMWKPISSALGNSTSSVLLSCVTGLLLGIPFATEMGLSIIHYLDLIIGGSWWILILWTAEILAVFLIRGRPYNGDVLVNDLHMTGSMSAFLALSWNVLLPIGLIVLAITQYKISQSNQFFYWKGKSYFGLWARKVGGLIQIGFLLLIPITAFVQIYRYLTSGPRDILDRIQLLYRPTQTPLPHRRNRSTNNENPPLTHISPTTHLSNLESQSVQDDAPPKYTPPPSYTTATGARLAKMLRQSIRRSVRRFLGESSSRTRPSISTTSGQQQQVDVIRDSSLPPEYSTVLSNPSGNITDDDNINIEIGPRPLYNSSTQRTQSMERRPASVTPYLADQRNRNTITVTTPSFTAFDVAQILRSSHRHERSASAIATSVVDSVLRTSSSMRNNKNSRSAENLVLNAAPLGESNAIVLSSRGELTIDNDENTSVI